MANTIWGPSQSPVQSVTYDIYGQLARGTNLVQSRAILPHSFFSINIYQSKCHTHHYQ